MSWVYGEDVGRGSIAALDHGVAGERYSLDGRPDDVISTAECCNRVCAIAGIDHHVDDVDPRSDPAAAQEFGPTLMAIAEAATTNEHRARPAVTKTSERIGYQPRGLDDGLAQLVQWLRDLGRI